MVCVYEFLRTSGTLEASDNDESDTEIQVLAQMLEGPTASVPESRSVDPAPADSEQAASPSDAAQAPTLEGATCRELFL